MTRLTNLFILIAEDDQDDAELVKECFEQNSSFDRVEVVQNGQELIDFLSTSDVLPNVILTDINMPILDGIEALIVVSKHDLLSAIPAFIYSTTINPVYEKKCKELNIKGFLIKPFNLKEFKLIPTKILNLLLQD